MIPSLTARSTRATLLLATAWYITGAGPAPQSKPPLWQGESSGFRVVIGKNDLEVTPAKGAQNPPRLRLSDMFRGMLAKQEAAAIETADEIAYLGHELPIAEASLSMEFIPRSLVGRFLTIEQRIFSETPGAAHSTAVTDFVVYDLADEKATPSLFELFPEKDLLAALLNDGIVKKHLNGAKPKSLAQLEAVLEKADTPCEYTFAGRPLRNSFAFHHIEKAKVAVRIGLQYGCEAARGNLTQLGVLLPIPPALEKDLKAAATTKGGFLMKDAPKALVKEPISFSWEKDLTPLIEKAKAEQAKKATKG